MKDTDIAKPTRRTVEKLFQELYREMAGTLYEKSRRLSEEREELAKKLVDVPAYNKLDRAVDKAYKEYHRAVAVHKEKIRTVRNQYLAKGLTPSVLRDLEKLVEELR